MYLNKRKYVLIINKIRYIKGLFLVLLPSFRCEPVILRPILYEVYICIYKNDGVVTYGITLVKKKLCMSLGLCWIMCRVVLIYTDFKHGYHVSSTRFWIEMYATGRRRLNAIHCRVLYTLMNLLTKNNLAGSTLLGI